MLRANGHQREQLKKFKKKREERTKELYFIFKKAKQSELQKKTVTEEGKTKARFNY